MASVQTGDSVKVHYTGTLDSGEQFDTSEGGEPLGFTVGAGQVIPGFDQALLGMQVGETKQVAIPVEQAYGERREELMQTIAREQFNLSGAEPQLGLVLEMRTPDGSIPLVITELTDASVTLDANHPLAGQPLNFALTLVEIEGK